MTISRGLIIALVVSVVVLAAGLAGLAAYTFLGPGGQPAAESPPDPGAGAETTHTPATFFEMKNFVTDLANRDRLRYVDVTVALALRDEAGRETARQLEPQIRDAVLSQLRSLRAEQLAGADGKDRVARAIETQLSEILQDHLVAVYITDLVVQ